MTINVPSARFYLLEIPRELRDHIVVHIAIILVASREIRLLTEQRRELTMSVIRVALKAKESSTAGP